MSKALRRKPRSRRAPELLTGKRHYPRHIFIPDTQVRPGVPINHIEAAGNYIREKQPDVVVIAGDWWDMPSLSSYEEKGSAYFHDKTFRADVDAGNHAMGVFMHAASRPVHSGSRRGTRRVDPRYVFLDGNHEHRIWRASHRDPVLRGTVTRDALALGGLEVHPFLKPVCIDGVLYCHYFVNPHSLKKNILCGTIDNRLNKIKQSFTMGHQQTRMFGSQYTLQGREIMGLVAGAFYQHDEEYAGPQGNHYWRGIVVKNEVHQGRYDPCFVSLEYLLRKYL